MADIESKKELIRSFVKEKELTNKLRSAVGFCKNLLEINATHDSKLNYEERLNFEKCLTENFLLKHGFDYFGKRDLIYVDLYGSDDVARLTSPTAL